MFLPSSSFRLGPFPLHQIEIQLLKLHTRTCGMTYVCITPLARPKNSRLGEVLGDRRAVISCCANMCEQLLTGNQSCHLMSMWYINVVISRLFVLPNCCPIWCRYNGLFTHQLQHSPPWKFPCRHPAWGFPWILVCSLGESTLLLRAALQPIKVAWRPSNPQTKQFYSTNEARSAVLLATCWMCVAKWLEVLRYFKTVKFTWHQNVVRSNKIREVNCRYDTKWTYAYVPHYFAREMEDGKRCALPQK